MIDHAASVHGSAPLCGVKGFFVGTVVQLTRRIEVEVGLAKTKKDSESPSCMFAFSSFYIRFKHQRRLQPFGLIQQTDIVWPEVFPYPSTSFSQCLSFPATSNTYIYIYALKSVCVRSLRLGSASWHQGGHQWLQWQQPGRYVRARYGGQGCQREDRS